MSLLYRIFRPLLFRLDPELSHDLTLALLARLSRSDLALGALRRRAPHPGPGLRQRIMGLDFPHPIGLAAGLDKDARAFPALAAMGFAWVELGTVTPEAQPGNPKKRLFRLAEDAALINRMGFNSTGLVSFMRNLASLRGRTDTVVGINIGKNAATPLASAIDDYLLGLESAYDAADYIAVNVSSPNTRSLRELQQQSQLESLLAALSTRRKQLEEHHLRRTPLALKIAPDLNETEVKQIADLAVQYGMDAIIATNTTIGRPLGLRSRWRGETGGLSGRPLKAPATKIVTALRRTLAGEIPIIGVGGVEAFEDAWEKLAAGADLIQIYTSFVYQGATVVRNLLVGLEQELTRMQISELPIALKKLR